MDIKEIRKRAQGVARGEVTANELEYARSILRSSRGNISSAIYVVGLCGDASDAILIERYLSGPDRDIYGELALKALCRYLGLVEKYREMLRSLIMSDDDIGWENSRMSAINLADIYLENFDDRELGCRLLEIMINEADKDRIAARNSLVHILQLRSELAEPFAMDLDITSGDAKMIVAAAERRFRCSALNRFH
ncbi:MULTISPECIES: hypothetical protein [Rhizobium]|uniref:hypothetical protein n=1 Tax=Rhizobium TaxID=379 RepID=UPI001B33CAFE|nr:MULTISPECIES: hypothetical protein [Rhizobium]MBX4907044.1 hypothetical protein [Rhizobium bangladeshense]MBX5232802.1 hypothetical protein [Rhizobium sp. NLR4a]MBX5242722.1 hypothetical protein [Rhizobium sp. NLR22b]MBX5254890.1 hypothetical protein [Rhizobium sp. NLR4b]MBX5256158.1 hypothetical protein [Rhizobium sp. NLR16b]